MSEKIKLFTLPDLNSELRDLVLLNQEGASAHASEMADLIPIFSSMTINNIEWDNFCQYSNRRYGGTFRSAINDLKRHTNIPNIEIAKGVSFLFLTELDLSTSEPLPENLSLIKEKISTEFINRDDRVGLLVKNALTQLPTSILKSIINSPKLGNLKDFESISETIENNISSWEEEVSKKEKQVTSIKEKLDEYQNAFNFVGLYQGFADLESTTSDELKSQRNYLRFFGAMMLIPLLIDLALIYFGAISFESKPSTLLTTGLMSATSTLVFLYFFRIVLRDVDSKVAQIMQIRLRMTLCQFIQSYASYASEIKEKNVDLLSKFEALIFSGIVGTQDKLPSTFDGIEQIGALLKTAKGK